MARTGPASLGALARLRARRAAVPWGPKDLAASASDRQPSQQALGGWGDPTIRSSPRKPSQALVPARIMQAANFERKLS